MNRRARSRRHNVSMSSETNYNLRSKKRKTNTGGEIVTSEFNPASTLKRKSPIMLIPFELLQNIFKFISFHELGRHVRSVNRKFKMAAEDLLNKSFRDLNKRIVALSTATFEAIEITGDDMEIKCLCRLLNLLDIVQFQQSVIMATIWRYVYNVFYKSSKSCMYAGLILDLFEMVLKQCACRPYQIYGPAVAKDYALPDEIKHLIQLTKNFCIHFDKVVEEPIKNAMSLSGCKIVDLLDCANYATKNVIYERTSNNTFSAKYCYFLHNAWFVAFGIPPEKEMTLRQKQRMMHMRIRRIILAHTEMFMQQSQYERELLFRTNPVIKKPSVCVYTGYGDVHDTFFIYGAMNDAAYLQKFHPQEDDQTDEDVEDEVHLEIILAHQRRQNLINLNINNFEENNDEDDENNDNNDEDNDNNINENNEIDGEAEFAIIPHLGLDIDIKIDCPLSFAPINYIKYNRDKFNCANSECGMFNLTIEFNCPGSYYARLPPTHHYHKRVSTRLVRNRAAASSSTSGSNNNNNNINDDDDNDDNRNSCNNNKNDKKLTLVNST